MYNSWIDKYDEIVEHRTDKEQLIKKQPVIAREYVEKNYIHKDKIKELRQKIHNDLDHNAITRGYQIFIDEYFEKILKE